MSKPTGLTNYYAAVNWLHGSLILCNEISKIDYSVLDNMRKELSDEETGEYTENTNGILQAIQSGMLNGWRRLFQI